MTKEKVNLNKQQKQVVNFKDGFACAVASAGSGKSRCIVERVKALVKSGVKPSRILTITFTKDSAKDLKKKLGGGYSDVHAYTFHALCLRELREHGINDALVDIDWKLEKALTDALGRNLKIPDVLSWISYQKNYGLKYTSKTFAKKDSDTSEHKLRQAYEIYQNYLKEHSVMDFDDMLLKFVDLYDSDKNFANKIAGAYDYVMVDEHQDSNEIQNEILKRLTRDNKNLLAVLDARQSIYEWRGSSLELALNFTRDWDGAEMFVLPVNYRSDDHIVKLSNEFIKQTYGSYDFYKDAIANSDNTGEIHINPKYSPTKRIKELVDQGVKPDDIAILYRNNHISAEYEFELKRLDIPYAVLNGDKNFFTRYENKLVLGYLKLAMDNTDRQAYQTVYNTPNRYLSRSFMRDALSMGGNLLNYQGKKSHEKKGVFQLRSVIRNIDLDTPSQAIYDIIEYANLEDFFRDNFQQGADKIGAINGLAKIARGFNTIPEFLQAIERMKRAKPKKNGVKLMTIHGSKGLEFKHVFVVGVDDEVLPSPRSTDEEERRLFYVGITRAIEELYIYGNSQYVLECNRLMERVK